VTLASKDSVNQPSSDFCSNLSGLFFLLHPLSALGFLIAQVVGQIPYTLMGSSWALSKKHEGTDTSQTVQEKPSETYTAVFATAGQDAVAMVTLLPYFTACGNSKQENLQISAFPVPSCIIHVADAAAIKVHLLYICRIEWS
jgi:hypothetical protein